MEAFSLDDFFLLYLFVMFEGSEENLPILEPGIYDLSFSTSEISFSNESLSRSSK